MLCLFGAHPNSCSRIGTHCYRITTRQKFKDLDVFSPPSFNNEDVADHANLETHFIDSSGLISGIYSNNKVTMNCSLGFFPRPSRKSAKNLMALFRRENKEVYIMDYQHLGVTLVVLSCRECLDIYPVDDLIYANNNMGMDYEMILIYHISINNDQENLSRIIGRIGMNKQSMMQCV